jgi:hypothetical protein
MSVKEKKFAVEFSDGKTRYAQFTWESIDYLLERYESLGEAYAAISALVAGPAGVSKKTLNALFDFIAAVFISDDPELTSDKIKKLVPYNELGDFAKLIQLAVDSGSVEVDSSENPQKVPEQK